MGVYLICIHLSGHEWYWVVVVLCQLLKIVVGIKVLLICYAVLTIRFVCGHKSLHHEELTQKPLSEVIKSGTTVTGTKADNVTGLL